MRQVYWGIGCLLILASCAQVGAPGGGEQDRTPPQVVEANPPFGQTGFAETQLVLTFDEFVKLQDARMQVLVSPPLNEPPRLLVKGRSVLVDLGEEELMADRTYVVQFGNAIRDLRESNVAAGLTHVFSTGTALDSGRIVGTAVDAWTSKERPGARVLLYADSLPLGAIECALPDSLRPMPEYVGLVNDSGVFDIGFLPVGEFAVVALDDVNGNYRADEGEALAWLDQPVASAQWDSLSEGPELRMDAPPLEPALYLSGSRVDSSGFWRGKLEGLADLMQGPDGRFESELGLALMGPDSAIDLHLEGDSLWAELTGFTVDSASHSWQLVYPGGLDSLKFGKVERAMGPIPVESVKRQVDAQGGFSLRMAPLPDSLDLSFCSGEWVLEGDTSELDLSLLSLDGGRLKGAPLVEAARYSIELAPGALRRQGVTHVDTLSFSFSVLGEDGQGSILLSTDRAPESGVLHVLTDAAGDPMYDRPLGKDRRFSGLPPGRYGVVRILDKDGNGRWSGAEPLYGRHPERIKVLANDLEVRAGWEVELTESPRPRP